MEVASQEAQTPAFQPQEPVKPRVLPFSKS